VGTGPRQAGRILEQSAPELVRIWRLARAAARQSVFPGTLDGVMESFFRSAGRVMAEGGEPESAWKGVGGTVRLSDRLGPAEPTAEWAVAMEVLAAVCESFGAEPAVGEWIARAVAEGERATAGLSSGREGAAPGLLPVRLLCDMPPPRRVLRAAQEAEPEP